MADSESDELLISIRSLPLFAHFLPSRNDLADRAGVVGREEQPAIGNGDDGARAAAFDGNRIFPDYLSVWRHAADLVGKVFSEPEVAIRRHRDTAQGRVRGLHRPLGDAAVRIDTAK